jgi:hypothetical protein
VHIAVFRVPRQNVDDARGANATIDIDRQSFLGELICDGETLELLAVGAMIEHKIVGPYLEPISKLLTAVDPI